MKYKRQTKVYRNVEERLKDWGEVYDHKEIRATLRKQAARYFSDTKFRYVR